MKSLDKNINKKVKEKCNKTWMELIYFSMSINYDILSA